MPESTPTRFPLPEGLQDACSELLSALHRVRVESRTRLLLVTGGDLAARQTFESWLLQFSERQMRAPLPIATHGAVAQHGDGVAGMLAEALGAADPKDRQDLRARLSAGLESRGLSDADDVEALLSCLWPDPQRSALGRAERITLLTRLTREVLSASPQILYLQNVQWGEQSLALVNALVESSRGSHRGQLVVMGLTEQDGQYEHPLGEGPLRPEQVWDALRPAGACAELMLPNLGRHTGRHTDSVDGLLDGSPEAAQRVAERLAFLGRAVSGQEWAEARPDRIVSVGDPLLIRLADVGIIRAWRGGWIFMQERARQRLLARAEAAGRARHHHAEVAALLSSRYGPATEPERLALHLLGSDRPDMALGVLDAAAAYYDRGRDLIAWDRLARMHERLADLIGLTDNTVERVGLGVRRAAILRARGRLDEARAAVESALQWAGRMGASDSPLVARGLLELGQIQLALNDTERARTLLERSRRIGEQHGEQVLVHRSTRALAQLLVQTGDLAQAEGVLRGFMEQLRAAEQPERLGEVLVQLGEILRRQGKFLEALEVYRDAERLCEVPGLASLRAQAMLGQGEVFQASGRLAEASPHVSRALVLLQKLGNARATAQATCTLADLARKLGDLGQAEALYRAALELFERYNMAEALQPRVNLALVLLGRGLVQEARELLENARIAAEELRNSSAVGPILALLLPCYAEDRAWDEWDAAYQRVHPLLAVPRLVDGDLAWAVELAGEWIAQKARQPRDLERAVRSWELAYQQRRALNDEAGLERARVRLLQLARMGAPIPLGPFNLDRPRGEGGLGMVWAGRHSVQGVSVAVKVLTAASARRPQALAAFEQEVRSVAGLDHPGIVMVLDSGAVTDTATIMAEGRLVAGSPYLAMQFCHGGSLVGHCGRLTWNNCRRVLMDLLAALGHAHARGVIHRDVKPANVLLQRANDFNAGVVLTDFGIAHALREGQQGFVAAGTPEYMAPEQFTTDWRMHGPWTDLYSLGCLAVALVSGEPPFSGESPEQLRQAHCWQEPPPLVPRVAVPEGFESWVLRLLQKRPQDRFVTAADAAWALQRLGAPGQSLGPAPGAAPRERSGRTFVWDELDTPGPEPAVVSVGSSRVAPWEPTVPPAPVDWRPHHIRAPRPALQGAGLGLFGLREPPYVGHEEERGRLWSMLLTTLDSGGARGVLLRGPAGVGKTRLARWLVERAYALGQAVLFRVDHSSEDPDALITALAQRLRCSSLNPAAARVRVEAWAQDQEVGPPALVDTLVEVLSGQRSADDPESREAVCTAIASLSRMRPVLMALDDVPWGGRTLEALRGALTGEVACGVGLLTLLTARDEHLAERPREAAMLEELVESGLVTELRIGPLPEDLRPLMVGGLLDLEHSLQSMVASRTEGNPAFANALLSDWVRRDVVQPGPGGFQLRPGSSTVLPEALAREWCDRLDRLGRQRGAVFPQSLELAAVYGETEVELSAWRAACGEALLMLPQDAVDRMIEDALLLPGSPGCWRFAHPMLREAAELAAEQRGVASAWRRAWARVLARRGQESDRARIAMLRMRSGQPEQALEPVRDGVRSQIRVGRPDEAAELVELWEEALRAVGVGRDDPRWGDLWLHRAEVCMERGYSSEQARAAQRTVDTARRLGWTQLLPRALWLRSIAHYEMGEWDAAWSGLVDAREKFRDQGDVHGVTCTLRDLGRVARAMGRLEESEEYMEEALSGFRKLEDWRYIGRVLQDQGSLLTHRQNIELSELKYQEALSCFRRAGYLLGEGECLNNLGELHRYQGRLDLAEATYRRAATLYRAVNTTRVLVPQLNLGLVLMGRDQFDDAERLFQDMLPEVQRNGSHMLRFFLGGFRLAASHPDYPHWEELYRPVAQHLSVTEIAEADLAWPLELAANRARRLRRPERARALYALARSQWQRLGVQEAVARVEHAEEALGSWLVS